MMSFSNLDQLKKIKNTIFNGKKGGMFDTILKL